MRGNGDTRARKTIDCCTRDRFIMRGTELYRASKNSTSGSWQPYTRLAAVVGVASVVVRAYTDTHLAGIATVPNCIRAVAWILENFRS